MGGVGSKHMLLSESDGDGKLFKDKFVIDHKLGEGEFGIVNLIRESNATTGDSAAVYAVKVLPKGVVFRDNTVYTPLDARLLKRECEILQALQGQHYTLALRALFESKSTVYIVTEYCAGGMMMDYLAKFYGNSGLSTLDISRISYQLLDAVRHCVECGVIHRDIKPENIMFTHSQPQADLRLIDFGCGAMDTNAVVMHECITQKDGSNLHRHATYIGTPFYTSPELFQRSYSNRTDVWSTGVTLYVLVAGFPSDKLQKAFDMLHKNDAPQGGRQDFLKTLPHMPTDLPQTFFDVLDMCLTYSHKHRKGAKDICPSEFLQFHTGISNQLSKDNTETLSLDQVTAVASNKMGTISRSESSTQLYIVEQTARRHTTYLEYGKFERSLTALLAAILNQDQLKLLIQTLDMLLQDHLTDDKLQQRSPSDHQLLANKRRLQVVKINEVKAALKTLQLESCVQMIEKLPSYQAHFNDFAYHFKLLGQFCRDSNKQFSVHRHHQKQKLGERQGHPLDVSFHHDQKQAENHKMNDLSVSRKIRQMLLKVKEDKKKKKTGELNGHPLDKSGHTPTDDSHKGMTVHGTQIWNQLKKGSTLDLSSSAQLSSGAASLGKTKRISSMLNLDQMG